MYVPEIAAVVHASVCGNLHTAGICLQVGTVCIVGTIYELLLPSD